MSYIIIVCNINWKSIQEARQATSSNRPPCGTDWNWQPMNWARVHYNSSSLSRRKSMITLILWHHIEWMKYWFTVEIICRSRIYKPKHLTNKSTTKHESSFADLCDLCLVHYWWDTEILNRWYSIKSKEGKMRNKLYLLKTKTSIRVILVHNVTPKLFFIASMDWNTLYTVWIEQVISFIKTMKTTKP